MRRQVQWGPLWCHHVRRVQGIFPEITVLGYKLPVPETEELCGGQGEQEQVPVLQVAEMHGFGDVKRCCQIWSDVKEAT